MEFPPDVISLSVREFSRISGLGESTIWKMIHDCKLESIGIGRRRLVLLASYRQLIKEQQAGPPRDARRNGTVPALGTVVVKPPHESAGDGALDRRVDEARSSGDKRREELLEDLARVLA